jgi:hypothetical protein
MSGNYEKNVEESQHGHSSLNSRPEIIDATLEVKRKDLRPYPEVKDQWITLLAIGVIGLCAVAATIALLVPVFFSVCDINNNCKSYSDATWPAEAMRLALVASLAFVMGSKQN